MEEIKKELGIEENVDINIRFFNPFSSEYIYWNIIKKEQNAHNKLCKKIEEDLQENELKKGGNPLQEYVTSDEVILAKKDEIIKEGGALFYPLGENTIGKPRFINLLRN